MTFFVSSTDTVPLDHLLFDMNVRCETCWAIERKLLDSKSLGKPVSIRRFYSETMPYPHFFTPDGKPLTQQDVEAALQITLPGHT
jgi:hypothetical protein